jgi:hypothetical protein
MTHGLVDVCGTKIKCHLSVTRSRPLWHLLKYLQVSKGPLDNCPRVNNGLWGQAKYRMLPVSQAEDKGMSRVSSLFHQFYPAIVYLYQLRSVARIHRKLKTKAKTHPFSAMKRTQSAAIAASMAVHVQATGPMLYSATRPGK